MLSLFGSGQSDVIIPQKVKIAEKRAEQSVPTTLNYNLYGAVFLEKDTEKFVCAFKRRTRFQLSQN
jgi:hypothetical protein